MSEFEKLKNSIKEGSVKKMKFHAHSIKGISLNVCAGEMKNTALAFESILETVDMEKTGKLIELLETELERFKKYASVI
jgi:HPt (histidine-containing phosphotransfer) domain-containing protein